MTVAWFHVNRSDIGAPTILLRPSTTALLPLISVPVAKKKNPFSVRYIVKGKMVCIYDCEEILFFYQHLGMSEGLFIHSFPGIIIKIGHVKGGSKCNILQIRLINQVLLL